jgi:chromosomal replication initiation ATPase DnaA
MINGNHINAGRCPTPNRPYLRDPACPVCQALDFYDESGTYMMRDIIKTVARQHGLSFQRIVGKSRRMEVVRARKIAMRMCIDKGYTACEVGKVFNRTHSTVVHHKRKHSAAGSRAKKETIL